MVVVNVGILTRALETARVFFEPQLRSLGFGVDQIQRYDLPKLNSALDRINDTLANADSIKPVRFSMNAEVGLVIPKSSAESSLEISITPLLLERKQLILDRIKELQEEKIEINDLRDLVDQLENDDLKDKLSEQIERLEAAQTASEKIQAEQAQTSRKLMEEDEKIQYELSKINLFREKSKVWLSFIERESVATVIGALLLLVITTAQIVAIFTNITTSEILNNSFLVILGYFFGQATSRQDR